MASNSAVEEVVDLNTQTLAESSTVSAVDVGLRTENNDSTATAPLQPARDVDGGKDQALVPNDDIDVKEVHLNEKGSHGVPERDNEGKVETCRLKKGLEEEIGTADSTLCESASIANSHILDDPGSKDSGISSSKSEALALSASGSLPSGDESRVAEVPDSLTPLVQNMGADIENLDRTGALQAGLVDPFMPDENPSKNIPGTSQDYDWKDLMVDSSSLVEVPVEHYSLPNEDAGPAHVIVSSLDHPIIGVEESSQEEDENFGAFSYNSDEYGEFNSEDRDSAMTGIEYYNNRSGNLVVDLGASFAAAETYGTIPEYLGAIEDENMEFDYSDTEEIQTMEDDIMFTDENRARYPLPQLRESSFSVSDLVWGKVRSHPWWPAQIFDPSDASEIAIKHKKRDGYLVAYFGDHTFAWNEASRLRPFCTHFTQMEKQSTLAAFLNAVHCALEEISRRVEFGLACYCIPDEVYNRIKAQVIDNTGIREGASVADSAYGSLNMTALEPDKLVQYVKDLAVLPSGGADRLELTVAKAQLLSFYRSKGYPKLPEFNVHRMLSENEEKLLPSHRKLGNDLMVDDWTPSSKKLKTRDGWSRKRKNHVVEDGIGSSKKQRSLADLMDEKISPALENGGKYHTATQSVSTKSRRGRKRKVSSLIDVGQAESPPIARKSFNVGECIRRVASQLTGSSSILKSNQEKSQKGVVKFDGGRDRNSYPDSFSEMSEEMVRKNVDGKREYPSPSEMLAQLQLAARDPMKGYSFLTALLSYFCEYRELLLEDNSRLTKQKKKMGASKTGGEKSTKTEKSSMETFKFDDVKDSYWTDRIVHNGEGESVKQSASVPINEGEENTSLDTNHELTDERIEEECSPTALILNFTDADSLPTESDLKKIFSRYGPLNESETEVMRKSKRAKVVFKRQADAEVAFSSAGKFSIFGPALTSYRLRYLPSSSKSNHGATTSSRKDASTMKDSKTSQLPKKSESQTVDCMDKSPLVEGSNSPSQLSEKDKIEIELESRLSTQENSSLMHKQAKKDLPEIACMTGTSSIVECEFRENNDVRKAGDAQPPVKEEIEKMCLPADNINQVEQQSERPPADGCLQMCELPKSDANQQEGVVELCSVEESHPTCAPPQNIEVQVECRAEVSTSKISQPPLEDLERIEYDKTCSMDENNQLTELPNNLEVQTEKVNEHSCGEVIDKVRELHEKEGSRTESGLEHDYLDLNQIDCGGKFCPKEGNTQLIERTKDVEMQKLDLSEPPCTEGSQQASRRHIKDGPLLACGHGVNSPEGVDEISCSAKKDTNQIECADEIRSREVCKPLTELPQNVERRSERLTDSCRESGKQVSELHDKEVNRREFISGSLTLGIGSSMSAMLENVEVHEECAGEVSQEGANQASQIPGAQQASLGDSNQMSEVPQKVCRQAKSLNQADSVETCSLMSEIPRKGDTQAESMTKFVSEGDCQTSESSEKIKLQTKSVSELPSVGDGDQVASLPENDVQQMESGSSVSSVQIPSEETGGQVPLLLGKGEVSTDCEDQLPVERQLSDTLQSEEGDT
ncbi:hypothetical protein H6P81_006228 [Aristolochia fimbriata]|uniref:PWWP domain-containing protein n=1 Tax=Aristolochia fimbriata TaxID=158543 RepID=A0AAV7EY43_ARIFI|nr:hypothetical protein H6P81_006228 [Aristolochia fimbriata]